jgi:2-succinyl-5-enolpyruvyl-6-hydroxy-3-cyclohexene-1-carboxylate synthase
MVDPSKSAKEETTSRTEVIDAVKDNYIRTVDEIAKVQPQYLQSISNLQLDYIQTTKNMIQTAFSAQKQVASNVNIPTPPYADLFVKQANEMTNNAIRAVGINNQLTINALDAARENLKIYNRSIDAVTDFGTNVAKAWTAFYTQSQQQFTR